MKKIEIEHLSFSYDEQIKALDDVSFSIEEGSYTVIVGHNGSGKSTIAKLMIGLMEAQSGIIRVDGTVLKEESVYDIRDKIGIVFQNPDNQFIGATVADDIAFGLENHQVPHDQMQAIIDEFAAEFQIELAAEGVHALEDPLRLQTQILFKIKSDFCHNDVLFLFFVVAQNHICSP